MARRQGYPRFEFRPGVNQFPRWRGLNRNDDPATIPTNQVWDAINVRLNQGTFVSRPGQSKFHSVAYSDCIDGIYDTEGDETSLLVPGNLLTVGGLDFTLTTAGNSIAGGVACTTFYSDGVVTVHRPTFTLDKYFPRNIGNYLLTNATTLTTPVPTYQSLFKLKSGKYLCFATSTGTDSYIGEIAQDDTGKWTTRPVVTLPDAPRDGLLVEERVDPDGDSDQVVETLYISTYSAGKLYRYNSFEGLVTDTTGLPGTPFLLARYREKVWLLGRSYMRYRDSAGVTTAITLPAFSNSFFPTGWAVWNDKLWVSGADVTAGGWDNGLGLLIEVDGTTATTKVTTDAETGIGGNQEGLVIYSVSTFDNKLFYYYSRPSVSPPSEGYIGRTTDGSSFTGTNISDYHGRVLVPVDGLFGSLGDGYLTTDGKNLYLSTFRVLDVGGGSFLLGEGRLFISNGTTTSGDWAQGIAGTWPTEPSNTSATVGKFLPV